MKKVLSGLLVLFVLAGCTAANIAGNWKSPSAESQGNGTFATRDFKITAAEWQITYTLYLDKEMRMPVFAFRGTGPYTVGNGSAAVKGAYDATFVFAKKYFTLLTDNAGVAAKFGFAAAKKGEELDITGTGISFLTSVKAYDREYDLVKLEGDKLYLGARPTDGSGMNVEANRPKTLATPLIKY
jgi:hypothetical protein